MWICALGWQFILLRFYSNSFRQEEAMWKGHCPVQGCSHSRGCIQQPDKQSGMISAPHLGPVAGDGARKLTPSPHWECYSSWPAGSPTSSWMPCFSLIHLLPHFWVRLAEGEGETMLSQVSQISWNVLRKAHVPILSAAPLPTFCRNQHGYHSLNVQVTVL